jgi:hypothetical protein
MSQPRDARAMIGVMLGIRRRRVSGLAPGLMDDVQRMVGR